MQNIVYSTRTSYLIFNLKTFPKTYNAILNFVKIILVRKNTYNWNYKGRKFVLKMPGEVASGGLQGGLHQDHNQSHALDHHRNPTWSHLRSHHPIKNAMNACMPGRVKLFQEMQNVKNHHQLLVWVQQFAQWIMSAM